MAEPALAPAAACGRSPQPSAQTRRQGFAHLLKTGVHVFIDAQQLIGLGMDLFAHPGKTGAPGFQVGHAHRVFIRHPQGQMACQGGHQFQRVLGQQGMQPAQTGHIQLRIGRVLVIGHAPHPFDGQGPSRLGQHRPHLIHTFAHDWVLGHGLDNFGWHGGGWRVHDGDLRSGQALGKGAQAAFHAQASALDGGLKLVAGERQQPHPRQRTEQHRADDAALLLCQSGHVKTHQTLGSGLGMGQELIRVHAAIAQG